MCLEAHGVLIKVNPATREERSMQAYWSRPLGCGECLAGTDSLVRSLTLIHWTLIRMALPGLDASVITAFVSHSPPSPPPQFYLLQFFFFFFSFSLLLFNLSNFIRPGTRFVGRNKFKMHLRSLVLVQNCVHLFHLSLLNSRQGVKLTISLIHRNLVYLTNTFTKQTKNDTFLSQKGGWM